MYLWKKGIQKSEFYTDFKELILFFIFTWMRLNILSCKLQKELLDSGFLPQSIPHRKWNAFKIIFFSLKNPILSIFVFNLPLLALQKEVDRTGGHSSQMQSPKAITDPV